MALENRVFSWFFKIHGVPLILKKYTRYPYCFNKMHEMPLMTNGVKFLLVINPN